MSPLFGPILAQIVTLGVADRSEVRYVIAEDSRAEAATSPRVALGFGWRHNALSESSLTLGYAPTITVTPLEAKRPDVLVFQLASVGIAHSERWARTTFTVSESAGYIRTNPQIQALGAPPANFDGTGGVAGPTPGGPTPGGTTPGGPTPGGMTGTGTPTTGLGPAGNPARATDQTVDLFTTLTLIGIRQSISPTLIAGGDLGYFATGSVNAAQRNDYPIVKGPRAQVYGAYRVTRYDTLTTTVNTQFAAISNGNHAVLTVATETWLHRFDARTTGNLATGVSISRNSQPDGLIYWSVYPTFNAGIAHLSLLGRSTLTFGFNAGSTPVLDPIRASVDPRVTLGAFIGLIKDRFSTSLIAGTAVSLGTPNDRGTLNSITGSYIASYRLGAAVSVDTGVRAAWQTFEGFTTVPAGFAAFAGLTFGTQVALNSGR